ncbi:MAG: sugar kinase, partial [Bacteroides sp.]|nr:sugar kinase [Bacteroides sp.]
LVQYSDVIFGAEPEYKEILGIQPVGFKAVSAADTSFEASLPAFEEFGRQVVTHVPRCRKAFLELRNSITSNHNLLAAVLYSDNTLKHTGIYDIEHEVDRVGAGDAFVGGMIYGLITYPDDDRKALEYALAASALKNTVYGDFNQVTVEEVESLMQGNTSGRVSR